MKRYLSLLIIALHVCAPFLLSAKAFTQSVKLEASFDKQSSTIELTWNMVSHSARTGYVLIKSTDGKTWTEAARDKMLKNYSEKDIYSYNDRLFTEGGKASYRIKIFDEENNTVALSSIVTVTPKAPSLVPRSAIPTSSSWAVYPNPVSDVLNLACKGTERVKGIINVEVTDMTGKPVKKFRAASTNRSLQIPVENLRKGIYAVVVTIENQVVLSDKFMKQ